jgi:hypothetical protein
MDGVVRRRYPSQLSPSLSLVSVYRLPKLAPKLLYQLLQERQPHVNISHAVMPTWRRHVNFIASRPYSAWYLIKSGDNYVGGIYLTRMNEIGIAILKRFRGFGFAPQAIRMLMLKHGKRLYLANINPRNKKFIDMFKCMGFRFVQQTYQLRTWKERDGN